MYARSIEDVYPDQRRSGVVYTALTIFEKRRVAHIRAKYLYATLLRVISTEYLMIYI